MNTQLEVPIPEQLANQKRKYQIHLKSSDGQIYVLLVNKDPESDHPVAVQVPPPKDIADALEKVQSSESSSSPDDNSRQVGRKSKAVSSIPDNVESSKKFKLDPEASEVETILSGKVLDTHIPGLDEYTMSHESKRNLFFGRIFFLSKPCCNNLYQ